MMEERIVNRLKNVSMGYHPFKVELKDFGSFPSHTIYINVTSKVTNSESGEGDQECSAIDEDGQRS